MKFLVIYLYALKNSGHFEFVHSVLEFAQKCVGVTTHLADWLGRFEAAVDEEERIMGISLKSVITEQLAKLDGQRDGIVAGLHGLTNAMLKSLDGEKVAAAQSVMNELVSLKVDTADNYMNQTGQIDTLVGVLLDKEAENVTLLGLMPMVQELKSVNDMMHALLNQRAEEQMGRSNDALAKARVATDAAYAEFIFAVEAYTFLHANELAADDLGFAKFVNDTNARIEYFRRYVLKINSVPEFSVPSEPGVPPTTEPTTPPSGEPGEPSSPSTPTEPPTTEPVYATAHFLFHSGQTEELRQLVGSLLHAPQNTEGYRWVPSVPSTMPAVNTSYSEEADGVVKYTVAWYLPNGNPIVWYDLAPGEVIPEAPEPPEGYYWHPYPDVMPEHDLDIIPEPIKG